MQEITELTICQTLEKLKSKEFSALELVNAYIRNIEKDDYNSYITKTFDLARESAKISDYNISKNQLRLLEAIPFGIKDLFCTKNILTTCASKMLKDFIPSYESTVTQKLWSNGAIMLGKANMDEFAMGSTNTNSYFNSVINPHKSKNSDKDLVPGGSSGGSAVVVAANLAAASLGSDTGGSVRQPASFTGTVGMKPTYGRCSRYGMIAFASSLDQAGIFTKDVKDSALILNSIAGYDENDPTSVECDVDDYLKNISYSTKGKKIALVKEYDIGKLSDCYKNSWNKIIKAIEEDGGEIIEVSIPHIHYAPEVYYILSSAEASSNLARYDGVRYGYKTNQKVNSLEEMYIKNRSEAFGEEVKRRMTLGAYVLSSGHYDAYYSKAQKVRNLIWKDFKNIFNNGIDVVLCPTVPNVAFPIDESINLGKNDPISVYLNDVFTIPASLAGIPAMSLPFGYDSNKLPFGIQLISNHFQEQKIFNLGLFIEKFLNKN